MEDISYVYWIFNADCKDYTVDGYIGVTRYPEKRFKYHSEKTKNIPKDKNLEFKIIFTGTRKECFDEELKLRPKPGIGWNNAIGGSHGWKFGFLLSDEAKQKMKDAWTENRRKKMGIDVKERNLKRRGKKVPKQSIAISGEKNPMFGKTHSKEARLKISMANKGIARTKGFKHNFPQKICPHCGRQGAGPNMTRFHFDKCKNKIKENEK